MTSAFCDYGIVFASIVEHAELLSTIGVAYEARASECERGVHQFMRFSFGEFSIRLTARTSLFSVRKPD